MNKPTRQNLYIALTYSITLIGGMFLGYKFLKDQGYAIQKPSAVSANHTAKVEEIMHLIDKNYVDEVNIDTLNHLPIDSLLHQLDPHSNYLPPDKATAQHESLEGNFEGIGIEYYILNDTLLVTNVVRGGPAYSAGVKVGDRILKIDKVKVSGQKLEKEDMIGKIKGKKGTPVQLVLLRPGGIKPLKLSIKRGRVMVSSIDASYMLNPTTGYIRISRFGANTDVEFRDSLSVLKTKGMSKLVLDLRDNGGGYLSAATGLANQLFAENELIVYTEGKHEPRTDYISTGGGIFEQGKLAVLINENTASASEILAGAVQDLDRGVIIGRRSFGKGLVQEQFPFGDGSALNLTIARYYTPLGRSIQKSYKDGYAAYQHELDARFDGGELTAVKNTKAIKPKEVDGGGIHPDIYVKMDTAGVNKFYQQLLSQKILFDFVYDVLGGKYQQEYLDKNLGSFNISSSDFNLFIKYLERKKITIDYPQLHAAKMVISNDLRVLLYKYHLGDSGYFKALNQHDQTVKQALTSLK
ncbi:carboxyl-terminal processing protease [Pedobacter sp. CAN_A7]|uniref:S41 family peptidase n=1 Tax=Pedobacter sp. CAN_A7 TaxID=2787722 RepID=UPI0018C97E85